MPREANEILANHVYVAAEYALDLKTLRRLKLVLTVQNEAKMGWAAGQTVTISGRAYVLGERTLEPPDGIVVHYDLHVVKK